MSNPLPPIMTALCKEALKTYYHDFGGSPYSCDHISLAAYSRGMSRLQICLHQQAWGMFWAGDGAGVYWLSEADRALSEDRSRHLRVLMLWSVANDRPDVQQAIKDTLKSQPVFLKESILWLLDQWPLDSLKPKL